MVTFIIVILVGRAFFSLAKKYAKNPVPFTVVGVLVYYFTEAIVASILTFSLEDLYGEWISYAAIPFGLLAVFITYQVLKSNWSPKESKERQQKLNRKRSDYKPDFKIELKPATTAPNILESKLNTSKPVASKPETVSRQATGRYNKSER